MKAIHSELVIAKELATIIVRLKARQRSGNVL
jgi:hypothetical protein